jgi:hypothetical protein
MARPVDALSAARHMLSEDGTVLVVDGLVGGGVHGPCLTTGTN